MSTHVPGFCHLSVFFNYSVLAKLAPSRIRVKAIAERFFKNIQFVSCIGTNRINFMYSIKSVTRVKHSDTFKKGV